MQIRRDYRSALSSRAPIRCAASQPEHVSAIWGLDLGCSVGYFIPNGCVFGTVHKVERAVIGAGFERRGRVFRESAADTAEARSDRLYRT